MKIVIEMECCSGTFSANSEFALQREVAGVLHKLAISWEHIAIQDAEILNSRGSIRGKATVER